MMSRINKKKDQNVGNSLGNAIKEICYFLTILFCALRVCGVISWSWFWIMSPIFLSWIIGLVGIVIGCAIAFAVIEVDEDDSGERKI